MLYIVGNVYLWLGDLEVSGMVLREVQVGLEGSIGTILLKAQDMYPRQGHIWNSKEYSGVVSIRTSLSIVFYVAFSVEDGDGYERRFGFGIGFRLWCGAY